MSIRLEETEENLTGNSSTFTLTQFIKKYVVKICINVFLTQQTHCKDGATQAYELPNRNDFMCTDAK